MKEIEDSNGTGEDGRVQGVAEKRKAGVAAGDVSQHSRKNLIAIQGAPVLPNGGLSTRASRDISERLRRNPAAGGLFEFFVVDGNSGFPTSGSIEIDSSLTFRGAQGLYCSAYQLRKRPPHPYLLGHVGKAVEIVG